MMMMGMNFWTMSRIRNSGVLQTQGVASDEDPRECWVLKLELDLKVPPVPVGLKPIECSTPWWAPVSQQQLVALCV
jgi:hypothetical protein